MRSWPLPRVLAHRCGGALAPENTLAGLDAAAACACRGVEFDVMLSADGHAILIHDEFLERTTNGHGAVAKSTLADLSLLDAGGWFAPRFAGEGLPTLEAALDRCMALGLAVNLEIKPAGGYEPQTGRAVADLLASIPLGGLPGLVLSSFSDVALAAARAVLPGATYGLLVEALPDNWRSRAAALGVHAMHVCSRTLTAAQIASVRSCGYQLAVYTENDAERAFELLRQGVGSVITDRPDRVREADMAAA